MCVLKNGSQPLMSHMLHEVELLHMFDYVSKRKKINLNSSVKKNDSLMFSLKNLQ